jgi:hypothetical protein
MITYFYKNFNTARQYNVYPGTEPYQPKQFPPLHRIPRPLPAYDAAGNQPCYLPYDYLHAGAFDGEDVLFIYAGGFLVIGNLELAALVLELFQFAGNGR